MNRYLGPMHHRLQHLLWMVFLAFQPSLLWASDWPSFHGPSGLGVSDEKGLPLHWSSSQGLAWKREIPGKGASSPIAVRGNIYLTSQTTDTGLHVFSIDAASGALVWDKELGKGRVRAHQLHNMATPTAVADGKHVWVRFGTGLLACLDSAGTVVWERNLSKEFGEFNANHGMGTSPMLLGNRLLVACMHQGPSYLMALDPLTGKTLWKTDRNLGPKDEAQDSYESPIFMTDQGKPRILLAGSEAVNAYDPETGKELWLHGGLKVPHPYGRTISGLAGGDGTVVVVTSGFQNRGFTTALKVSGKGQRPEADRLWTCSKFSPDCSTPVVYRGKVFMVRDDGMASCLDLKTGAPFWQERLFTGNVKVSPVAADGHVYFLSGEGNCYVVEAAPVLKVVAENRLGEPTLSTPALSGGRVFIRTDGGLYCFKK